MVMTIKATVNESDYDNMLRNYWLKEDIDADLEVDGVLYKKGEIAFRGTTSLNYPKKGFKVKFSKKALYRSHTKRFDLSASYADKSLIRERLCFDLFGQTRVVSSKAWHIDFIIQGKEGQVLDRGLYTGIERVDKYFFRNRGREIGSLYKADGAVINGAFVGATLAPQDEATLRVLYDKKHSKKAVTGLLANVFRAAFRLPPIEIADVDDEDYSDLDSFIGAIHRLSAGDVSQGLDAIMDVDTYLDWLAVNTLVQSNDTYHKNYFLHNRVEDDIWEIMPWDYDLSFGRNWNDHCDGLCDDLSEGTSIKGPNQMLNELSRRVLNNSTYFDRLRDKLLHLLETEFTEEKLFRRIDAYYDEVTSLAHMDTKKWPTDEEFDRERERLKDWIKRRRHFLFKELGAAPSPPKLADTIITQLAFNKATLIEGDEIAFEAMVHNVGGAPTGPTVGVAFLIDGAYITFGTSSALEPGASHLIKSVSSWEAVAGDHTLLGVVDDVNRYPEVSETNNTLETQFQVSRKPSQGLPDVVVKDIAFERDELGQARLAALVSNVGQVETSDVVGVAFFVDDQYTTFGVISPLKAGESRPIRAVRSLPLYGPHKITAVVDDVNRFPEELEQNNVLIEQIDFGDQGQVLADTVILNVTMGNGRFSAGDAITFEAVVKNIGTAPTGDVVGVAFLVDGQYITFGTSPSIPPDTIQNIRAVSSWRAVTGRHRLLAIVDDVNRYPEISETNNRFELDFQVFEQDVPNLPDSTIKSIGFESDADGQIVLNADVANIGNAPTSDVVGVAFFVDGPYATYGVAQPMDVGATQTIRAVKPLPLEGTHQITAIVDDVNRYDELSHQNNALSREITFPVADSDFFSEADLSRVFVARDPAVTSYPARPPFDPPEIYPEYPHSVTITASDNAAYGLVREALRLMAPEGFGSADWNPLGVVIHPGDTVLLKPNLVDDATWEKGQITHPAFLRAVIDYAYLACGPNGRVLLADGPWSPGVFDQVVANTGIQAMVEDLTTVYGVPITMLDLNGVTEEEAILVDLGSLSELSTEDRTWCDAHRQPLRVDGEATIGRYRIALPVLQADVILSVPKVKVHCSGGITITMKNMLGIIPCWDTPHENKILKNCAHTSDVDLAQGKRGEYLRNDTVWRSIVDLNRILLYADDRGVLHPQRQRRYLSIVDGIIAGTTSQFNPTPYPLSTVIIGSDPASVDAVAARAMGYDHRAIKSVAGAVLRQDWTLGPCHPVEIKVCMSDGDTLSKSYRQPLPPEVEVYSWQGHIEATDFDPPTVRSWTWDGTDGMLRVAVEDPAGVAWVRLAYEYRGERRLKALALAEGTPASGTWVVPFSVGAAVRSGILLVGDELFNEKSQAIEW